MFINVENGKVKLYDLRIYKKLSEVQIKLKYDSTYEYINEKNTWYSYEHRDGVDFRILQSYKKIGVVEHNDFFSSDEDLFKKYRKGILGSLRLVELLSLDILNFLDI